MPSENIISGHTKLSGVMIVGDRKFQPAAILEAKEAVNSPEDFIEEVWPLVQSANQVSQKHGQLVKSKLAVVNPGTLVRAPKGTIIRSLTISRLAHVIEQLYSINNDRQNGPDSPVLEAPYSLQDSILKFVRQCAHKFQVLANVGDEEDFFIKGLDSVETIELARSLKASLQAQIDIKRLSFVTAQFVYHYPTIKGWASISYAELSNNPVKRDPASMTYALTNMIEKYTSMIVHHHYAPNLAHNTDELTIILTGSSGSLGRQLLETLLTDFRIGKVFCLDRNSEAKTLARRVLPVSTQDFSKATFIQVAFGEPGLGLTQQNLAILEQADVILHNAWKVDFNHSLASFEP